MAATFYWSHLAGRMKILVAEDDAAIAEALCFQLRKAGYTVDLARDGEAAEAALAGGEPDLLILDLGLPKKSGLEVLKTLRERGARVPVLVLTALDDVAHRVRGLDAGADDYLHKPFEFSELEARVRALARRGQGGELNTIALGALSYDRAERLARVNGEALQLSAPEGAFLETLLERTGRLVSREQLSRRVAESGGDAAHVALEDLAHGLRRQLEPAGVALVAVAALGYCLEKLPPR